jgi:hypothetical protein
MLTLKDKSNFQQEYESYKKSVNAIAIDHARDHGKQLLQKLLSLSTEIERAHDEQINAYVDPRRTRDKIVELVEVRKQLARLIKDAGS